MRAFPGVLPLALLPLALLALVVSAPAAAQAEIVIYRCVDAAGAVTLQNDRPCPPGSQQSVRRVAPLPTRPPPPAGAPAPPAAPQPTPAAPPAAQAVPPPAPAVVRGPPPPLFRCRTWDDRDYLGDSADPPATCVPLQTVGIDGSSGLAAGSACEMRRDACEPVPAEQRCAAWKKRVDEAEFRWKFGGSRDDARKAEFERVAAIYRDSDCMR